MNLIKSVLVFSCIGITSVSSATTILVDETTADSTGLPGDHFSLEGALEMFKKSKSLEDFEKQINAESNNVNNLDLNGDGQIDYIRVSDKMQGTVHAIVLQTAVNESETQDIAVIEIEKNGEKSAMLQIVGDDELYPDSTIVEPKDEIEKKTSKGPAMNELATRFVVVNVWYWPCVTFIYAPVYVPWVSPWYWHHYPGWWSPWRPYPWYYHHSHCAVYRPYYHVVYTHRMVNAHRVYAPNRRTSTVVAARYKPARENYRAQRAAGPNRGARSVDNSTRPARNGNNVDRGTQRERQNVTRENRHPRNGSEARPSRQQREGSQVKPQRQPREQQRGGNRSGGQQPRNNKGGGGRR